MTFTIFFIRPRLIWVKKHFVHIPQRIFLDISSVSQIWMFYNSYPVFFLNTDRLSQRLTKQQYFVTPACILIWNPITLRTQQYLLWYCLYLLATNMSCILSYDSFRWTQRTRDMLGYLFPFCRSAVISLRLEKSMKSRQYEGLWGKSGEVKKSETFL